jgi:hypothetical protein
MAESCTASAVFGFTVVVCAVRGSEMTSRRAATEVFMDATDDMRPGKLFT